MKVVLTGATGLLGGNLAIALLEAGHEVVCAKRATSRIDPLSAFDLKWIDAPLDDEEALVRAFDGAEVAFHVAAVTTPRARPTPALVAGNVEGTRHVLSAVRRAGVRRLLHVSSVVTTARGDGSRPVTEDDPWDFAERGLADGYCITKRQAEDLALAAEDLDVVVVNPSYMVGPYDVRPSSGQLLLAVVKGEIPGIPPGGSNFVDVREVARGILAAAERGRRGERYILGGQDLLFADFFERVAEAAGVKPPRWKLPRALVAVAGWGGDLAERLLDRDVGLNSVAVRYGYAPAPRYSSEKAARELDWRAGPLEPAIRDALAWWRQRGML